MIDTGDGLRLFAQRVGEGSDTVVIPNRIYLFEDFQRLAQNRAAIFYDPRNRGLSDTVTDAERLVRGIHHDVDDLEAIRRHYGLDQMAILAHSYIGIAAVLYAVVHPHRLSRLVLMGPMPPDPSTEYPAHLRCADGTLEAFHQHFAELQKRAAELAPEDYCQKAWALLRTLYVAAPKDADRLHWAPCDVPNEVNFMRPFLKYIMPSLSALRWTSETLAKVTAPVLIVHGREDRSSPYGAGRDWARLLPNARLLTVDKAAHVPWIEDPEAVYGAIDTFLDGAWPPGAEACG